MKLGDHIRITRDGVSQHAIAVGDRTVLHFVKGRGVKRSRLDELAGGAARVEVVTHRQRVYAPKHVVARAFSRLSSSAFSAMFHDSEGFATWCKAGTTLPRGAAPPSTSPGVAAPIRAAKSRKRAARAAARPSVKKAGARKISRPAATARARGGQKKAAAKSAAAPKQARAAKKVASRPSARKAARPARAPAKAVKPAAVRKPLSRSAAKPPKRAARIAAVKPKRAKVPGKRAAAGR